jgi:hypothetical protein
MNDDQDPADTLEQLLVDTRQAVQRALFRSAALDQFQADVDTYGAVTSE